MKDFLDSLGNYFIVVLIVVLMIIASSCTTEDDDVLLTLPTPTLKLNGNLELDSNGYYRLDLKENTNQTIHRISGVVHNHQYYESLKVSWDSNLTWEYQGEVVSTSNQASYVVDGKVYNVIAPINTMIGDTLILTGTIREHLVTDSIKIILE